MQESNSSAWHHEKLESKKNSAEKQSKKEALREANEAEQKLEQLVQEIGKDSKLWTHILQSLVDPINNTDLHKRFGKVPSTKKEEGKEEQGYFEALKRKAKDLKNYVLKNDDYENSLNIAKFALQFFGESQLILTYNRHLYDMNELMSIEKGQKPSVGVYIDDGADENFDKFMQKVETHPLKVESEECEKYMKEHKLGCASMRCLLAYTTSSQIMSYVKNGYQELQKIEHFNHNAKSENLQILWIEEKQAYGIEIDADYRKLVKAIEDITQKFSSNLRNCFLTEKKLDFSNIKDVKTFSQFYDKTFQASVMEWTEQYFALTKDQKLLQSLYNRFYIDGNHLTPYELQFILLSLAHLQTINRSPIDFLLLLISSVSQGDIINVILYIRIVYDRSTLFRDNGKIYKAIELIESPRYKALLALRINEHGQSVDSEQIYKILLMLQHASNNSEQLENIGLSEWIDIANKQKWSEIGGLIKKYGPIGYYLGILDGKNKNTEERLMRQMFDHVKYVSEKQIAEFTQLIANGDILGDKEFFDKLEDYFKLGNDFQCPSISEHSKLPHLFTDQAEQSKFIKFVDSKNRADPLLPDGERTIDEIEKLVVGLHDVNEEDKNRRLHEIKHVANLIRVGF
uniref:Uncharacterized protein n=1 Tax=Panagrolaimus sp. ES5 TaxID=591445 RepID=A0AC34G251_9BILA